MSHHTVAARVAGWKSDPDHVDGYRHGHSRGAIDASILRSRDGVRAVLRSLAVLGATALLQTLILVLTDSVALLSDAVHNIGDALTALPVGIALVMRSERAEAWAGRAVVAAIFISGCVAVHASIDRLIDPQPLRYGLVVACAGSVGLLGNLIAALIRKRAGQKINSSALMADAEHARADALVSLGVVISAAMVGLGWRVADPIVGLIIGLFILHIAWDTWKTLR